MATNESGLSYAESTDPPSLHFWTKALADNVRDQMLETSAGARKRVGWGTVASAAFASGDYVITHSLGWTPEVVLMFADVSSSIYTLGLKSGTTPTSTQMTARMAILSAGAATLYTGNVSNLRWVALG